MVMPIRAPLRARFRRAKVGDAGFGPYADVATALGLRPRLAGAALQSIPE